MALSDAQIYNGDGSTRDFTILGEILSESHLRVWIDDVLQSSDDWDLLGNTVLFNDAPDDGANVQFLVSTTGTDFPSNPSAIGDVSININDVITVAANIGIINTVANNKTNIDTIGENISNVINVSNNIEEVKALNTAIEDGVLPFERIVVTVNNIDELLEVSPSNGDTVIVKDLNRGGTFIYDATKSAVNNGGTVFNGWVRKYSGAINVKWFGAVGDGITDDTVTLQSALDVRGNIVMGDNTYLVSDTIKLSSDTTLISNGKLLASEVFPDTKDVLKMKIFSGGVDDYVNTNISVIGLTIEGNNVSTSTSSGSLVSIVNAEGIIFENCTFTKHRYIAVVTSGTKNVTFNRCTFEDNGLPIPTTKSSPAIWCDTLIYGSPKNIKVTNCKFKDNNWSAAYFMPKGGEFSNNYCENNGESTVFSNSNSDNVKYINNTIKGTRLSNISSHGIEIGGSNHIVSGNTISEVDGSGITLTDCSNTKIIDNTITGYGQNEYFRVVDWGYSGIAIISSVLTTNIVISNNIITAMDTEIYPIVIYNQSTASSGARGLQITNNNLTYGGSGDKIFIQSDIPTKLGFDCIFRGNSGFDDYYMTTTQLGLTVRQVKLNSPFPVKKIMVSGHDVSGSEIREFKGVACMGSMGSSINKSFNLTTLKSYAITAAADKVIYLTDSDGALLYEATILNYTGEAGLGVTLDVTTAYINPAIIVEFYS